MPAQTSRQFLDTNILPYAYDQQAGEKREKAAAIVRNALLAPAHIIEDLNHGQAFATTTAQNPFLMTYFPETDGPWIECHVLINFGVVPKDHDSHSRSHC